MPEKFPQRAKNKETKAVGGSVFSLPSISYKDTNNILQGKEYTKKNTEN